jgi:hypothetical protein
MIGTVQPKPCAAGADVTTKLPRHVVYGWVQAPRLAQVLLGSTMPKPCRNMCWQEMQPREPVAPPSRLWPSAPFLCVDFSQSPTGALGGGGGGAPALPLAPMKQAGAKQMPRVKNPWEHVSKPGAWTGTSRCLGPAGCTKT